jgi:hypothetical protein
MRQFILALIATLLMGCASTSAVQELGSNYVILKGTLVTAPELDEGGHRLWIYLKIGSEVEGESPQIVVCLAVNREKERVLYETQANIMKVVEEPIFIYATKQTEPYEEIVAGVDYSVHAIGYYMPHAQKYKYVLTTYGTSLRVALRDLKWTDFVKAVGKAAFKAAKP